MIIIKVLILSCNTGGGHNSAGIALKEAFLLRGAQCEMLDTLQFRGEKVSRVVSGAYVNTVVKSPRLFGFVYKAGRAISSYKHKSPIYFANMPYAKMLADYINTQNVEAVVMPHLFPAEAMTYLKATGKVNVPAYLVSTDYTCIPFFEEVRMDRYFIPSEELRGEFTQRGLDSDMLIPSGIPVAQKFSHPLDRKAAREQLGIDVDARVILIMSDSMGFGNVGELVRELVQHRDDDLRIIVMGANNSKLKTSLRESFACEKRLTVLDFTDRVSDYMAASDVLMTKPGGLSTTEAAVLNIPFVHTPPIPGCEICNVGFFTSRGMSLTAPNAAGLAGCAMKLLCEDEMRKNMQAAQRRYINPNAALDIADYVLGARREQ